MSEYIWYLSFWIWVTSINMMFSRSIHLPGSFKMSLFFLLCSTPLCKLLCWLSSFFPFLYQHLTVLWPFFYSHGLSPDVWLSGSNFDETHIFQGRNIRIRIIKQKEQRYEKNKCRFTEQKREGNSVNDKFACIYFPHAYILHSKEQWKTIDFINTI